MALRWVVMRICHVALYHADVGMYRAGTSTTGILFIFYLLPVYATATATVTPQSAESELLLLLP